MRIARIPPGHMRVGLPFCDIWNVHNSQIIQIIEDLIYFDQTRFFKPTWAVGPISWSSFFRVRYSVVQLLFASCAYRREASAVLNSDFTHVSFKGHSRIDEKDLGQIHKCALKIGRNRLAYA